MQESFKCKKVQSERKYVVQESTKCKKVQSAGKYKVQESSKVCKQCALHTHTKCNALANKCNGHIDK